LYKETLELPQTLIQALAVKRKQKAKTQATQKPRKDAGLSPKQKARVRELRRPNQPKGRPVSPQYSPEMVKSQRRLIWMGLGATIATHYRKAVLTLDEVYIALIPFLLFTLGRWSLADANDQQTH